MTRLRVLHVGKFYPPYKGGMETHLQQLCRSTAGEIDLNVIVANDSSQTVEETDGPIRIHRMGTLVKVASAPICPAMVRAIQDTPADIVHLHSPNPTAVLSYFAARHPGRLVVTHHSDIVRQRWLKIFYEPWLRRLMGRADAIVCFSPNYLDSSLILNLHRAKCRVIPHGIDADHFSRVDSQAVMAIKRTYGPRMILGVGRLVYYKGFEFLIRALVGTDATLVIIGTGPLQEKLATIARRCQVAERVHFLGEVPDVSPYYHAARIFVLPAVARSEAFGIVQLEAMASGTPVINCNLQSGVPFVSPHLVSGLTVPPEDSEALRQAINELLSDDALHQRLAEGARQRVRQHFTLRAMAEKTLQMYEELMGKTCRRETVAAASRS